MSIINLTPAQLRNAADIQEQISKLQSELATIFGGTTTSASAVAQPVKPTKPAKRTISAAHIAKIRAAQKLRWAKVHAAKAKPAVKPVEPAAKAVKTAIKPAKKKISAEGIARIKAAQKARWAKIKVPKAVM
jgi:DNA-binding PucR family transcriptional regulator